LEFQGVILGAIYRRKQITLYNYVKVIKIEKNIIFYRVCNSGGLIINEGWSFSRLRLDLFVKIYEIK